ncbi:trafficking protein particle complex subunit 8-like [Rhincodon typus]|uniref:trafficking protein particle complex subunit 8-like n=1 Tax=Rhincodon typus TaxID=259920 RepID=UPI00202E68A3|nr:trafficking protein particle complex subunit 8-like [Rhincodon typus]
MAQCVQSVQEFIQDTFVPMVAVLCSEAAESSTRKNNLSFAELVRPFCRLTSEVHMRDPNNQSHVIKNLRINVTGIVTQPPQQTAIRKLLSEVVSASQPAEGLVANVITAGDYDLNISGKPSVSLLIPEMLEIHGSFTWLGQTQYKIQLKGQEVYTVPLKACFVHAGVYNLGTPRVFARLADQNVQCETSQQNSTPALIIINNV